VRRCEEESIELNELPLSAFSEAHALFTQDVFDALSPLASVEQRDVEGGTSPAAVRTQLEAAESAVARA
jgi:argininosuccinate lyase